MEVVIISAVAKNRVIGKDNAMPWHLKEDFEHFKNQTSGFPIIMGKKTFESIGRPLPNRENIILTRFPIPGFKCFDNLKHALDYCKVKNNRKAFLIGGASVYKEGLAYSDTILLTEINKEFEGDTFFPPFEDSWKVTEKEHAFSEENNFAYSFNTYKKK